jgi:hypothetical protein
MGTWSSTALMMSGFSRMLACSAVTWSLMTAAMAEGTRQNTTSKLERTAASRAPNLISSFVLPES